MENPMEMYPLFLLVRYITSGIIREGIRWIFVSSNFSYL